MRETESGRRGFQRKNVELPPWGLYRTMAETGQRLRQSLSGWLLSGLPQAQAVKSLHIACTAHCPSESKDTWTKQVTPTRLHCWCGGLRDRDLDIPW